ncbi:MAG TPA: MFS transporter [Rheinheimera sp.]|nr:MFS transporter [Rheinheimera sp.]
MSQGYPVKRLRFSLGVGIFLAAFGTSSANVALPQLADDFAVSFASVQWVVLAYLLTITVLIVIVGRLSDIHGAKRLLQGGVLVFAAASVACACSEQFGQLLAARAVQGVGAAILMSLCMALVPKVAPADQAPRWIGFLASMSAVGTALGPALGGVLLELMDWRALFFLNLPFAMLAWFGFYQYLPADHQRPVSDQRFDWRGAGLLAAALVCYALTMTVAQQWWLWSLTATLVFALLFVGQQQRIARAAAQDPLQRQPLLRMSLFRQSTLRSGFLLNFLVMTVMMTTLVVGPFYLATALGLSALQVGAVMALGPLITASTALPLGSMVQRFGSQRVMNVALLWMTAGAFALTVAPQQLGLPGYLGPFVLLTLGYATFQTSNNSAVMAAARVDERGVIAGLLHLARNLGQLTGAALMGAVFAWAAGSQQLQLASALQLHHALAVTFACGGLLLLAATLRCLWPNANKVPTD